MVENHLPNYHITENIIKEFDNIPNNIQYSNPKYYKFIEILQKNNKFHEMLIKNIHINEQITTFSLKILSIYPCDLSFLIQLSLQHISNQEILIIILDIIVNSQLYSDMLIKFLFKLSFNCFKFDTIHCLLVHKIAKLTSFIVNRTSNFNMYKTEFEIIQQFFLKYLNNVTFEIHTIGAMISAIISINCHQDDINFRNYLIYFSLNALEKYGDYQNNAFYIIASLQKISCKELQDYDLSIIEKYASLYPICNEAYMNFKHIR